MLPWGTPALILPILDVTDPYRIWKVHSVRYDLIRRKNDEGRINFSLWRRPSCQTIKSLWYIQDKKAVQNNFFFQRERYCVYYPVQLMGRWIWRTKTKLIVSEIIGSIRLSISFSSIFTRKGRRLIGLYEDYISWFIWFLDHDDCWELP